MLKKATLGLLGVLMIAAPAIALADYNESVEPAVRSYFADDPVMVDIASCESQFHQFNSDGSTLHGGYKHTMIGIYQIAPLHLPDATSRGYDVSTVAGNMAYAKYLYDAYGTSPWLDSSPCWGPMIGSGVPTIEASSMRSETASAVLSADERSQKILDLKWQLARLQAVIDALIAARNAPNATS